MLVLLQLCIHNTPHTHTHTLYDFSMAKIKQWPKLAWGGKGLCGLCFQVSLSLREVKAGTWGQRLQQRPGEMFLNRLFNFFLIWLRTPD